jgi:hypothetical protein
MKPAERVEEDGATQVIVHGFGEKDIHLVRAILAAKGYYALGPEHERYEILRPWE